MAANSAAENGFVHPLDNLVLLHPNCHRQLHSRDTAGLSPAEESLTGSLSRMR